MSFLLHKLVKLFESCKQLNKQPRRFSFSDFDTAIFVAVEPSAWLRLVSLPTRRINLRDIINILLTSFSRPVLEVTDHRFFPVDLWPARFALGSYKSEGKISVRKLTYSTDIELG